MKHSITGILIFALTLSGFAQTDQSRRTHYNVKKGLALDGYDPVSYFSRKPLEGKESYAWTFKGVTYRFSSSENLNTFRADPEKYEPAYGGWCAYAMGESGEKVKVDPETYKVLNGKLYLFYNFWGNNTLTEWNKNESSLRTQADQHWKKFVP
jgi:YHS domain-containing protein